MLSRNVRDQKKNFSRPGTGTEKSWSRTSLVKLNNVQLNWSIFTALICQSNLFKRAVILFRNVENCGISSLELICSVVANIG